jgi:hypothetical protein
VNTKIETAHGTVRMIDGALLITHPTGRTIFAHITRVDGKPWSYAVWVPGGSVGGSGVDRADCFRRVRKHVEAEWDHLTGQEVRG